MEDDRDSPTEQRRKRQFSLRGLFALVSLVCVLAAINAAAIRFGTHAATSARAADIALSWLIVFDTLVYLALLLGLVYLVGLMSDDDSVFNAGGKLGLPRSVGCLMSILSIPALIYEVGLIIAVNGTMKTASKGSVSYVLGTSPLIGGTGAACMFLVFASAAIVAPALIGRCWLSICPSCGKRRARLVSGKNLWLDFRCSACGFTKKNVYKREYD